MLVIYKQNRVAIVVAPKLFTYTKYVIKRFYNNNNNNNNKKLNKINIKQYIFIITKPINQKNQKRKQKRKIT